MKSSGANLNVALQIKNGEVDKSKIFSSGDPEMKPRLDLYFITTPGESIELLKTVFIPPEMYKNEQNRIPIPAERGKGDFNWTKAVKATCLFFLEWACWIRKTPPSDVSFIMKGEKNNNAAISISNMLEKDIDWPCKVFGADKNGNSLLKKVIQVQKSAPIIINGKSVSIILNTNMLSPENIIIYLNNNQIQDRETLLKILNNIGKKLWSNYSDQQEGYALSKQTLEEGAEIDAPYESDLCDTSSTSGYNVRLRKDFWDEILRYMESATHQIVLIGGISQKILNVDTYQILAKRLQDQPELTVVIYYESEDNLFRRSQYCENPSGVDDFRDFEGMLRRKQEIERIPEEIKIRVAKEKQASVLSRLSVKQIHLQLYLIVTQIDEIVYVTPISHHRNSRSVTLRVVNTKDILHKMAREYIAFLTTSDAGKSYCTGPDDEILQIFDSKGIPRGYCGRETLNRVSLRCMVVFGFLFNKRGEILIQKRSKEARDNCGKWDKSFGGHMKGFSDVSVIDTVKREFSEELKCKCSCAMKLAYLGDWNANKRVEITSDKCLLFRLYNDPNYLSLRILPNGGRIKRMFNVNAFIVICPCSAIEKPNASEVAAIRWITLSKLKQDIKKTPDNYTPDLCSIISSHIFDMLNSISNAITINSGK